MNFKKWIFRGIGIGFLGLFINVIIITLFNPDINNFDTFLFIGLFLYLCIIITLFAGYILSKLEK